MAHGLRSHGHLVLADPATRQLVDQQMGRGEERINTWDVVELTD